MAYTRFILLLWIAALLGSCKGHYYKARSSSMSETIQPGDRFYVKETTDFKKNDIVVFNYYGDDYTAPPDEETGKFRQHWEKRIFRLIAFSGDTIAIKDDEVFVNNTPIPFPAGARLPYDIYASETIDELLTGEEMATMENSDSLFIYHVNITKDKALEYEQRKPAVQKVVRQTKDNSGLADSLFARSAADDKWNTFNYGPLRIPAPGEKIIVNPYNFRLYQNIPGIQMGENTINEKLYFLLGDNRHAAQDSRFTGFISHSKMYGIVK
jgi:signal peptidase I